ncbi:MAG: hypothetical protein ABIQ98_05965 [Sphingomicrobium sp.]
MSNPPNSAELDWTTLRMSGESLIMRFSTGDGAHLLVIDRDVLEDGLATFNEDPTQSARKNPSLIDLAATRAFQRSDWLELIEVRTNERIFHLKVCRDDFEE